MSDILLLKSSRCLKNTAKWSGIASCFCLTLSMFSSPLDFQTSIEPLRLKELATSNLDNVSKPCGVQLMVKEAVTYPILRYSGSIWLFFITSINLHLPDSSNLSTLPPISAFSVASITFKTGISRLFQEPRSMFPFISILRGYSSTCTSCEYMSVPLMHSILIQAIQVPTPPQKKLTFIKL